MGRAPSRLVLVAVSAGLCGAGVLAAILFAAGAVGRAENPTTVIPQQAQMSASGATELQPSGVYASAAPGVVDITAHVVTKVQTQFGPTSESAVATGSGSILDRKGDVLTAEHVVAGAKSVTVKLQDGTVRKAKILGRDSSIDIAILKIDPSGLTLYPLQLGSSRSLRIGDPIFVIGDPFGYARSFSGGLVSALDRTIVAPNGFAVAHAIQTDAAINPGNSGGPLLDIQGRLVGVADQIATGTSGTATNTGVGFAVPVDVVKSDLSQLERGLTPTHAYLGIGATDATPIGALVQSVTAKSPAADAGVEKGDVIVALDATKITGAGDLVAAIAGHHPGDRVTLTIERASNQVSVPLTLTKQAAQATSG